MPAAITAQDLKDSVTAGGNLVMPPGLTDTILTTWITDETAVVLRLKGLTALPAAGLDLDEIKAAVRDLATVKTKRFLRPDDADFLDALNKERSLVLSTLKPVEGQGAGARFLEVV